MTTAPKRTSGATVAALKREAEPEEAVATVEYGGFSYTLPADPNDWDFVILENFENDHVVAGVRALLGDQWDDFSKRHRKMRDLNDFMEKVYEAMGTNQGK